MARTRRMSMVAHYGSAKETEAFVDGVHFRHGVAGPELCFGRSQGNYWIFTPAEEEDEAAVAVPVACLSPTIDATAGLPPLPLSLIPPLCPRCHGPMSEGPATTVRDRPSVRWTCDPCRYATAIDARGRAVPQPYAAAPAASEDAEEPEQQVQHH